MRGGRSLLVLPRAPCHALHSRTEFQSRERDRELLHNSSHVLLRRNSSMCVRRVCTPCCMCVCVYVCMYTLCECVCEHYWFASKVYPWALEREGEELVSSTNKSKTHIHSKDHCVNNVFSFFFPQSFLSRFPRKPNPVCNHAFMHMHKRKWKTLGESLNISINR